VTEQSGGGEKVVDQGILAAYCWIWNFTVGLSLAKNRLSTLRTEIQKARIKVLRAFTVWMLKSLLQINNT